MFPYKMYQAQVVSLKDPKQKARIQVRLLPEFKDIEDEYLPWVRPFMYQDMSNSPPDEESYVWVFFVDEHYELGFWISNQFIDTFYDYADTIGILDQIPEFGAQSYPDVHFKRYSNGTTLFHNSVTGDTGLLGNKGGYFILSDNTFTLAVESNRLKIDRESSQLLTSTLLTLGAADGAGFLTYIADSNEFQAQFDTFTLTGNSFVLNTSTVEQNVGIYNSTITNKVERVLSNSNETIGGTKTLSVQGDLQTSVLGKTNQLHMGDLIIETVGNPGALPPTLGSITIRHGITQAKIVITTTSIEIDAGIFPVNIKGSLINLG